MQEVSAPTLKARLDDGDTPLLLDVREDWEVDAAPFPGATHIPMDQVVAGIDDLPRDRDIVVICHHGGRSFTVGMLLERAGFERVFNLAGGIAGWSADVDPSVPMY